MLQSDDTLFLNVQLDNANSSIGDSNLSLSSAESPEISLNSALIAPDVNNSNSLKRKSSEGIDTTCKKRLLDDVSFGETSVTDTEFLRIPTDNVNAMAETYCSNEQFSQLYFSTQFERDKETADEATDVAQIQRSSSTVTKLTLTQMFNDDFVDDIDGIDVFWADSQMFLETVKTIGQLPVHPTQKLDELVGATYKSKNASIYVQLQRSTKEENESNVNDDSYVDPQLSSHQARKSVQYCRELEKDFAKCEQTIRNIDNLNESGRSIDMNVALDMSADGTPCKRNNASIYIQLQRSMQVENESNVNDDNFVDPELSQAIKSTQYRREIEEDFAKCEQTICNIDKVNETSRSIDMNAALDLSTGLLRGLNDMDWNWNSPVIPARTAHTPLSALVKKKLAVFSKSRETLLATPKLLTPTYFSNMGPFFDLPISVKSLIKEYKGIDELYGKRKTSYRLIQA